MNTQAISAKIKEVLTGNSIQAATSVIIEVKDGKFATEVQNLNNQRYVLDLVKKSGFGDDLQLKPGKWMASDVTAQLNSQTGNIDLYVNGHYYDANEGEWDIAGFVFAYDIKRGRIVNVDFGGGGAW
ncbi:TPA: hypothetical protein G8N92_005057 [Salmonella enterica]|nr:hypothetical protein [Salmonella enterica]